MEAVKFKTKKFKNFVAGFVFALLGKGMRGIYKLDAEARREIDTLPEGYVIRMGINGCKQRMLLQRTEKGLQKVKGDIAADLNINFKSVESALLVQLGRIGVAQAYAQHRFTLKGDIAHSMTVVRVVNMLENYLFPRFITNKFLKRKIKRNRKMLRVYVYVLTGI